MFETKLVFGGNSMIASRNMWEIARDYNKESKSGTFNYHGQHAQLGDDIRSKSKANVGLNVKRVFVEKVSRVGLL